MPHSSNDKFHHHVEYTQKVDEWIKITDLVQGEHKCLTDQKYLWLHSMEDPSRQCDKRDKDGAIKDRAIRETRTRYVNYARMVKERFVSLVMRGGLNPSDEVIAMFDDEINNVDGQDNDLDEFATQVVDDMVSYGVAYVITDSQTIEARNILEEKEAGARPYWIRISPLQFKDWQIGADGEYTDFRYEYMLLEQRASLEDEPLLISYSTIASMREDGYTLRTFAQRDKETQLHVNHHPDCATEIVEENAFWGEENTVTITELDHLPLATNRLQESVLAPVVDIALKIYNKQSDLDNILHNQCYDRVFVFADLAAAITEDGEFISDSAKEVKFATNSMVLGPEGGTVVKLEPTDPKALIESIRDDIEDLFRVAFNKARTRRVDSRAPESDRTQREIKEDLLTRIERVREKLLGILNKAVRDYAMFKDTTKGKDFQGIIEFAQSVTETDVEQLSAFVRAHADRMDIYEQTSKAIDKKLISHLNLPKETELFDEIDNTKRPDPNELVNQVGASKAALEGLVTNNANKRQTTKKVPKGNSAKRPKSN